VTALAFLMMVLMMVTMMIMAVGDVLNAKKNEEVTMMMMTMTMTLVLQLILILTTPPPPPHPIHSSSPPASPAPGTTAIVVWTRLNRDADTPGLPSSHAWWT
jgi:hypothetical protein